MCQRFVRIPAARSQASSCLNPYHKTQVANGGRALPRLTTESKGGVRAVFSQTISRSQSNEGLGSGDAERSLSKVDTHFLKNLSSIFEFVGDVVIDRLSGDEEAIQVSRTISDELDAEILYYVPSQMGVSIIYGVRKATSFLAAIPRMQGVVSWRLLPLQPTGDQQPVTA